MSLFIFGDGGVGGGREDIWGHFLVTHGSRVEFVSAHCVFASGKLWLRMISHIFFSVCILLISGNSWCIVACS